MAISEYKDNTKNKKYKVSIITRKSQDIKIEWYSKRYKTGTEQKR
jgi:hypothetical protein